MTCAQQPPDGHSLAVQARIIQARVAERAFGNVELLVVAVTLLRPAEFAWCGPYTTPIAEKDAADE